MSAYLPDRRSFLRSAPWRLLPSGSPQPCLGFRCEDEHTAWYRKGEEECRRQGIKLGFYYSQDQDWTAPGGAAYKTGDHDRPNHHWDPAQDGNFADYLHKKAIPQLKELLANYGEYPAVIWFDTPTPDTTPELAGEIVQLLNLHPNLIWNNRLGGGYNGDTETPEQYIPAGSSHTANNSESWSP